MALNDLCCPRGSKRALHVSFGPFIITVSHPLFAITLFLTYFVRMEISPIGFIESSFKEKFGTPRQSGIIQLDQSKIVFEPAFRDPEFFRGLEGMTHLWVIFGFHQANYRAGQSTVRPPRLGGKERMGIFACRSPHRPNNLGLSLVHIQNFQAGAISFLGGDMIEGTPVYDIKPYHPEADRPENYQAGYIQQLCREKLQVQWKCARPDDAAFIEEVIALDPRPSYQSEEREYGITLNQKNIRFSVKDNIASILAIELI